MGFEPYPTITLRSGSFNALLAPREMFIQSLREAAKEAAVLLYAPPGADPYFEELVKNADRVFCFDEGPRAEIKVVAKANARAQRSQTTLEAFT